MTLNKIQTSAFWIVCANSTTRKFMHYCAVCSSLWGKLGEQKTAELPFDWLQEESPFTCCGVDLFGPFVNCNKRKELKRYGVMFACLCSRAIHIEVAHSLDTYSFLLTLRRSENGSNSLGQLKNCGNPFKTWTTVE